MKTELYKLYLDNLLEKKSGVDQFSEFIERKLSREESFIQLGKFLGILTQDDKKLKTLKNYPHKYVLGLQDTVLHLYTIQTTTMQAKDLSRFSSSKSDTVSFSISIFLTEKLDLILLKCLVFEKEIVYCTLNLEVDEKISFDEQSLLIELLPEFLYGDLLEHREELYIVKKEVYKKIIHFYTNYSKLDDIFIIKRALRKNNAHVKNLEINKTSKKYLTLSYGMDNTKTIKFAETTMKPSEQKYMTRNTSELEYGLAAFIIKAIEPETNSAHYIYVSNIEAEIKRIEMDKEIKEPRLEFRALFNKKEQNFELERDLNHRSSVLEYCYIHEVKLS